MGAMAEWHAQRLGDGIVASEPLERIATEFRAAFAAAGSPRAMALFVRHDAAGDLHCEVTLYFSPSATEVAARLGATRCARPSPRGLSLVVGTEDCWPLLFPAA